MTVDLDSMKTSLATLFGDNDFMTGTLSEHVHPDVAISIPFIYGNPVYYLLALMIYVVPPLGYIAAMITFWGRFGWFYAHNWNVFWWAILFNIFFNFFWVWILDAWGWIEADWFWQILAPLNDKGEYTVVDDWVAVNTWTLPYTMEVIEKDKGVKFDVKNEDHMQELKDYTWPYIYETMNLINYYDVMMWPINAFWFMCMPSMYVDSNGIALDGYPLILAKSYELSKMYTGDYSWLEDPTNRQLTLDESTLFGTIWNILIGNIYYTLNKAMLDVPALISIWTQIYKYFYQDKGEDKMFWEELKL